MNTKTIHNPGCASREKTFGVANDCNCKPIVIKELEYGEDEAAVADTPAPVEGPQPVEAPSEIIRGVIGYEQDGDNVKLGHAPGCGTLKPEPENCTCGFGALMAAAAREGAVPLAPVPVVDDGLPDGDYAICEFMGHRTIIGRVQEIERFGAKYIGIEAIFQGKLLPQVLMGGSSVYGFTPCSKEQALKRAPKNVYQLPDSLAAAVPDLVKDVDQTPRIPRYSPADDEFQTEDDPDFAEVDEDDDLPI